MVSYFGIKQLNQEHLVFYGTDRIDTIHIRKWNKIEIGTVYPLGFQKKTGSQKSILLYIPISPQPLSVTRKSMIIQRVQPHLPTRRGAQPFVSGGASVIVRYSTNRFTRKDSIKGRKFPDRPPERFPQWVFQL